MRLIYCTLFMTLGVAMGWDEETPTKYAQGMHAAVATNHPLATDTALDVMKNGGNAIDAAVAAALMLGVVDSGNSGIGGGCFMLIRRADGGIVAIDGRETAPAAATRDLFIRDGKAVPELSQTGALAIGVPGALAAYDLALQDHGTLSLRELIEPAIHVADGGFVISESYASRLRGSAQALKKFEASAAIFLNDNGEPWKAGDRLIQKDLADTYREIASRGSDAFYQGRFAEKTAQWMEESGGLMTFADLAQYQAKEREPIHNTYRGFSVIGFPPPSSGGVHVAQMLEILESFDLKALSEPERTHVLAEAMKLAFADRAHWLGDPDFARVPRGLIDSTYAKGLANKIDLTKLTDVPTHGQPPGAETEWFDQKHTTHFTTADSQGNWVACTATVNTTYGSKVVIPGTGVVMNNEMDDFAAQPGVPNFFGLLGSDANAVEGGKRPLSSMSPTLVLKEGQPIYSTGAAGGPTIITQVLQALVRRIDLDADLPTTIDAPRIHHQWAPRELRVERDLAEMIHEGLRELGHELQATGRFGVSQALGRREDGTLEAVSDSRADGSAAAW